MGISVVNEQMAFRRTCGREGWPDNLLAHLNELSTWENRNGSYTF